MDAESRQQRATLLKAMAHPSRLAILEVLQEGERCVSEIQATVGSDLSTVSRHLGVLKQAGIVGDRRQGQQVMCYLRLPCVLNFFGCVGGDLGLGATEPLRRCCTSHQTRQTRAVTAHQ
ncbi:MAG: ArsR/SmtB family transcription factor [Chloroflexota bacterium]